MKVFQRLPLLLLMGVVGTMSAKIGNTTVEDDYYWGPEEDRGNEDTSIRPFAVNFTDAMIEDLRYRLKNHRPFVPPLEGQGFQYGFNSDQMASWITYWADEYPFEERVQFLNQFPQYKTKIQGLDVHFLQVEPKEVPSGLEVVPLLILHGWPGSVREFYETLPMLTAVSEDRDYAVLAIVPSLVGFGFSDATFRTGMGAVEMSVVFRNLMHRLGFKKFYIQGGDWGAQICTSMATLFPEEVLGFHTNFATSLNPKTFMSYLIGSYYPEMVVEPELQDRMYPISEVLQFMLREFGYFHIQSAKPDTIGIALSDTPSGLLAYILQLVATGTRAASVNSTDGGLDSYYDRVQLIDNLMMYWSTNTITTSSRIYAETVNVRTNTLGVMDKPTPVPTWTLHAKDEVIYMSPYMLKFKFTNLVNSTVLNTGGHFLALELPELFAENVLTAITAFRHLSNTMLTCQ